jgi:hypothetical protein
LCCCRNRKKKEKKSEVHSSTWSGILPEASSSSGYHTDNKKTAPETRVGAGAGGERKKGEDGAGAMEDTASELGVADEATTTGTKRAAPHV